MQVKTITTVAGVNEIDFGNDSSQSTAHFYWLKNLSDSTLYVSANPNPIAEKDDVAELPAKGAVSVETDEGKIYVLGAGKVEIHRTNSKFCPFDWQSSGSGGGETVDAYSKTESDAKYAQKTDIPTSLPANGGNADTVGGLHADDFVNASDFNNHQIPNNADIPAWIYANGKRYKIYTTNGTNTGTTNIPNDSTDYVWYWFDGVNIIAREWATGRYYICDVINGIFSGWKDVYTSGYKPYVTGTFTVNASDTEQTISVPLAFNPSVVLLFTSQITLTVPKQIILIALSGTEYKIKIGVPNSGDLSALSTGFEAIINSWKGITSTIDYIAYE